MTDREALAEGNPPEAEGLTQCVLLEQGCLGLMERLLSLGLGLHNLLVETGCSGAAATYQC